MKYNFFHCGARKLIVVLFAVTRSYLSSAQTITPSILNSAGNSVSISGNVYEWSIGELALVNTYASGNIIVTQGVLQPDSIPHTGLTQLSVFQDVKVYPNPAINSILVAFSSQQAGIVTLTIEDETGRNIFSSNYNKSEVRFMESVPLSRVPAGYYLLTLKLHGPSAQKVNYKIQVL